MSINNNKYPNVSCRGVVYFNELEVEANNIWSREIYCETTEYIQYFSNIHAVSDKIFKIICSKKFTTNILGPGMVFELHLYKIKGP